MTWIKEIVEGLVEVYGTRDVYDLIDFLDINLIKKTLPQGKKGRFFRDIFGNETIFVSDDLNPLEEKCTIAHELAHAILHVDLNTSYYSEDPLLVRSKLELQANMFAAELLIQDDINISTCDSVTIRDLSCLLGVSEDLVELKFRRWIK